MIFECYREIHSNLFKQKRGIWNKIAITLTLMSHRDSCVGILVSHFQLLGVTLTGSGWKRYPFIFLLATVEFTLSDAIFYFIKQLKDIRVSLIFSLHAYYYALIPHILKNIYIFVPYHL